MSDEEEIQYSDEEIEDEEEVETKSVVSSVYAGGNRSKRLSSIGHRDVDESSLTEAEKAMIAAKKRHEEEEAVKLQNYEDRRRVEREREEEEFRLLKEKQEQRRLQREEEEREMAERRQKEEERRRIEEEERRVRIEDERRKKEETMKKRQQLMGAAGFGAGQGGRNFVIPEKKDRGDKFGNIVQAKQEMGMTKEQQEDAKRSYLAAVMKAIDFSNLTGADLKAKIKELHQRICKLETDKYDLEKRHERQEYDAKVLIASKYDRQIDRRNFNERRAMFDKKKAFPCFPNVPPPPTILEYSLKSSASSTGGREEGEEELFEEEE